MSTFAQQLSAEFARSNVTLGALAAHIIATDGEGAIPLDATDAMATARQQGMERYLQQRMAVGRTVPLSAVRIRHACALMGSTPEVLAALLAAAERETPSPVPVVPRGAVPPPEPEIPYGVRFFCPVDTSVRSSIAWFLLESVRATGLPVRLEPHAAEVIHWPFEWAPDRELLKTPLGRFANVVYGAPERWAARHIPTCVNVLIVDDQPPDDQGTVTTALEYDHLLAIAPGLLGSGDRGEQWVCRQWRAVGGKPVVIPTDPTARAHVFRAALTT